MSVLSEELMEKYCRFISEGIWFYINFKNSCLDTLSKILIYEIYLKKSQKLKISCTENYKISYSSRHEI